MRGFAGVLLSTAVGRETILLIDEPEAFLHPPQARLLGNMLVSDKRKNCQLFVATHSEDILKGILDAGDTHVRVLRLRREGEINTVRELDHKQIANLWNDPLLRYSNILNGLFHEYTLLCEADADCRFYSAILDAVIDNIGDDARRPDVMFTHCGGKARMPMVISALRAVGVPVIAIADFDVLSDKIPLRPMVEAFGVEWDKVEADWNLVKSTIDSKRPQLDSDDVKQEISEVLSTITEKALPRNAKTQIQNILKRTSPWSEAKNSGKSYVPSGDPSKACERLLDKLREIGIFVVEVGELERFVQTVGNHGPTWVNDVLQRDLHKDEELEVARKFASAIYNKIIT